ALDPVSSATSKYRAGKLEKEVVGTYCQRLLYLTDASLGLATFAQGSYDEKGYSASANKAEIVALVSDKLGSITKNIYDAWGQKMIDEALESLEKYAASAKTEGDKETLNNELTPADNYASFMPVSEEVLATSVHDEAVYGALHHILSHASNL
nr:hypothetical protein [Bacilli bacterium]